MKGPIKPGIHLSVSAGRATLGQLGALVWTALRAEENGLGLPLDLIHGLSVHQSEPPPSHGSFVLSVDGNFKFLASCSETLLTENLKFLVFFFFKFLVLL